MFPPIARKLLQLFQHQFAQVPLDFQPLTPREKEGQSYKMIADTGQVKFNTVHAHKRFYQKLAVN